MASVLSVRYRLPVASFIDLHGASGVIYRFRLAELENLPASAGNFVCTADASQDGRVVCCGTTTNLVTAAKAWANAVKQEGAAQLYVRLNVASRARASEHDDLVAAFHPPLVVADPD